MMDEERRRRMEERWQRRAALGGTCGPSWHGRIVMSSFIILLGVLFLLRNLGFFYVDQIWKFWPAILIANGAVMAISQGYLKRRVLGGIMALIGIVLLLINIGYLPQEVWRVLGPVLLIFAGISLLFRSFWRGSPRSYAFPAGPGTFGIPSASSANVLHEINVFGGVNRRIDSQEFEGGEVHTVFGGVEIDLRGAATKKDEIHIELNAVFGGVDLMVPDTWDITVQGAGIFGGYEDKTMPRRTPDSGKRPHLVITGNAVFGGVTVK